MLDERLELELTGGGDTQAHFHLADRRPTHETLLGLQAATAVRTIAAADQVSYEDDIILADTSTASFSITLPSAKGGKEITVVKTATANVLTVDGYANETICGELTMLIHAKNTAMRLKAIDGGWVAI